MFFRSRDRENGPSREEDGLCNIGGLSTALQNAVDKPVMTDSPKLKDLVFLKNQLAGLQRKLENEVQAGVSQEGTLLSSPFLKGFLAGYIVSKLRASAFLGFVVGTCTGIYAAQAYAVPNVEKTIKDYLSSLRKGPD
ncbi:unnamed protein product [Ranitomeya imitator]|uniref:Uncharacterized protein n=2 Tax=Dendrobatinae TaxID=490054 RepID=A0ABN9LCH1_9NEOB|nr:unnamed protein product [Ranitomeya imitator]